MKRLLWIPCLLCCTVLLGQDLHFSQFNEQPALLNPALTGAVSNLRFSLAHRRQWTSIGTPYITSGASFEIRSPGRMKRTGKFGRAKTRTPGLIAGGLSFYRDNAGDGKLTSTSGVLSIATFLPAGKKNFFSFGMQAAIVQKKLDGPNLIYPNQFNGAGYDPAMASGEVIPAMTYAYADYSAGFLWTYGSDIKTFVAHHETKARLGFSTYHLNRPSTQFFNTTTDLMNYRYVAHGDLLHSIAGTHFAVAPSFMFQQMGNSTEWTVGSYFKYYNSNDTKFTGYVRRSTFGIGAFYRGKDAVIAALQVEFEEQFAVGLSYDFNISTLKAATRSKGGTEITFRYTPANSYLYQNRTGGTKPNTDKKE